MLELEARDTQSLQDGGEAMGGADIFKKPVVSLSDTGEKSTSICSPAPSPKVCKPLFMKTRYDTSLGFLTRRFADMVNRSTNRVLNINVIAQELNVHKRRVYDVTNVLEGIKLVKKTSKNRIEWIGGHMTRSLNQELKNLIEEEEKLDELIQSCMSQIHQMYENKHRQKFAYLSYDDVRGIRSFKEQTVIVIKAPSETKLEVPHPAESLQVHLSSTEGPIEVFVCSDNPINMKTTDVCEANDSHVTSSTNGNSSAPLSPCLSDSKDNAKHASRINISNPPTKPTQHISPATVMPVSLMPTSSQRPSEDQQSFVTLAPPLAFSLDGQEYLLSLADDQGITDLFSSVDLQPLGLDMPH